MWLKDKNILVTGAGGVGVGAGVCQALSNFGATILLNEIDQEKAEDAAKRYPRAIPIAADVSNSQQIKEMFEKLATGRTSSRAGEQCWGRTEQTGPPG